MSSRQHARSKKGKGPSAPRAFTAATGLTGSTPEELAHRAEITAAALALAERSEARAAKVAKMVKQVAPGQAPRAARPARSTRESAARAPMALGPGGPRPDEERPEPRTWRAREAEVETAAPKPPKASAPARTTGVAPPRSPRSSGDRPARVFKLPDATASSESSAGAAAAVVGLADGVTIAEALRTDAGTGTATSGQSRPTADPPKVSRAPRGGGRWRGRTSEGTDESHRRPATPTRPTASAPSDPTTSSSRWTLPLVGRKDRGTKVPDASSAGKDSGRTFMSKKAGEGQAPADKKKSESKRAKRKRAKKKTPATPLDRRRRIPVVLAGVFALAVLATNFPLSSILGQHHQLAAASAQLAQVQHQNKALREQQQALKSNVAINQLARGDLQMVTPGQVLYDVLPSSSKTDTTTPGSPTSGDPGSQPLVAPNNAPDLSPQQELPTPIPATAAGSSAAVPAKSATATEVSNSPAPPSTPASYWGRVADTLEFWR